MIWYLLRWLACISLMCELRFLGRGGGGEVTDALCLVALGVDILRRCFIGCCRIFMDPLEGSRGRAEESMTGSNREA